MTSTVPSARPGFRLQLGEVSRVQVACRTLPDGPAEEHYLIGPLAPRTRATRWRVQRTAVPRRAATDGLPGRGRRTALLLARAPLAGFRALLDLADGAAAGIASRDEAVSRARRNVAALHDVDVDALSLTSEQHDPVGLAWSVGMRARAAAEQFTVRLGFVDGYAGSLHVRPASREVMDSVGIE